MKHLLFVFLLLLVSCESDSSDDNDQNCNPSFNIVDDVLMGDLNLNSQEDIDEFDWSCINAISGNLVIRTITPSLDEPISDISSLSALVRIGGLSVYDNEFLAGLEALQNITAFHSGGNMSIYIENNPLLMSLGGLENLPTSTGNISIIENENLTSISALSQITHANSIFINENHALTSLVELQNLTVVNSVSINDNDMLTSLLGLQNITFVSSVSISNNDMLTNLIGMPSFNAIQSIDANGFKRIYISSNSNLVSLEGVSGSILNGKLNINSNNNLLSLGHLNGLTRTDRIDIGYNDLLTSLDGLESLILVDGPFLVVQNDSLNDFCAITNLAINGDIGNGNGGYSPAGNAYNPTLESIQMGNCSN